ncbi:MAG TPA: TMEM175 family protein, partial [Puia sp.]|nr:TMEM175 family protein [Puia sp.]
KQTSPSVSGINRSFMSDSSKNEYEGLSTQRLEAFSDGVFAIAITLLILEIKIPDSETLAHQSLFHYLSGLWPKYFAYVSSFIVIGIYWANHHYIFKLYKRTDHIFNILNVLFLMTISFLPFPTAIFGEYITDDVRRQSAVTFYAISTYLPAIVWLSMWLYGSYEKRLLDRRLTDNFIQYLTRLFYLSNLLYFIAIGVSFFSPLTTIILNIVLALLYLLPPKKPEYS